MLLLFIYFVLFFFSIFSLALHFIPNWVAFATLQNRNNKLQMKKIPFVLFFHPKNKSDYIGWKIESNKSQMLLDQWNSYAMQGTKNWNFIKSRQCIVIDLSLVCYFELKRCVQWNALISEDKETENKKTRRNHSTKVAYFAIHKTFMT